MDKLGKVQRQDFWHGNPYKLLGFSKKPKAGKMELSFEQFWAEPEKAIGMFPVFSDAKDNWTTQCVEVESVEKVPYKRPAKKK
jgi:hypothetical protein